MLFSDILVNKEYRQALFDKIECPLICLSKGYIQEINLAAKRLLHFDAQKDYQVNFHEFCQARNYSLIDILEKSYEKHGTVEETYYIKNKPCFIRWKMIEFSELNNNLDGELIIGRDFTHEQSIFNNIRKTKLFYTNILSKLPTYVYWKDKNCTYQGCNDLLAKAMGLPSSEAIKGMTDFDFNWGEKGAAESFIAFDKKVMRTGESLNTEDVFRIANGNCVTVLTNKTPLRDEKGEIIGILAISVDITDKKKAEADLIKAKEQAEIAAKAKSEFISNMSHDIRTPFSGLLSLSQILELEETNLQKKEFLHDIAQSAQELLNYLNGIIEYMQLDSSMVPVLYKPFDIRALIEEIEKIMLPSAKSKFVQLKKQISADVPRQVMGDRYRIHRILLNLVGNAIKFTQEGLVTVGVEVGKKENNKILLKIWVKDTGIGIPEDKYNVIFERFNRLTASYSGIYKGMGFGLWAVKRLIAELGGQIFVESELQKGSLFTCVIPFECLLIE